MTKRDWQQRKPDGTPSAENTWLYGKGAWVISGAVIVMIAFISYRIWTKYNADGDKRELAHQTLSDLLKRDPDSKEQVPPPKRAKKEEPGSLLDDFMKDADPEKEASGPALSSAELELHFNALLELHDLARQEPTEEAVKAYERRLVALEKELRQAKSVRPDDLVVRWLAGETLWLARGAPDEVEPHLRYAADHGLKRVRLSASLAQVQLESSQFADAYRNAAAGLEQDRKDRYAWDAFARSAIVNQQFNPLLDQLRRAFPSALPSWARKYQSEAEALQAKWRVEQKLRQAEAKANDLPRVRFVIEQRRFAKGPNGQPLTTVERTGGGEVILELFENEAPATVANFLDLVRRKFYDGTRFHLALPATSVVGGDPNSKKDDPKNDGLGGPGYVIPDEYNAPNARNHFRGSISMVKTKPRTAGSQFFISLAPLPEMDAHFTVFGRVIQGQDVIDHITRGRTTVNLEYFGKIIPGDLLVRAEVVRTRPSEAREKR